MYLGLYWLDSGKRRRFENLPRYCFHLNHPSYRSIKKRDPNIYPKDVPDIVADQSNQTSLDNSYDALNKFWPALSGGKKRGVKTGPNIKADKIHEDLYLACEDYQKLASRYIKMKRIYFLNYGYCAAQFTGRKSEGQYFVRFIVKFDNRQLEASAVMQGRSHKYVKVEKKLIEYLYILSHTYAQDKCVVPCIFMGKKCLKFSEGLGINKFKASPCWISPTLKRNKKLGINLHGESNDLTDEVREIIMAAWRNYFHAKIAEVDAPPECV